MNIDNYEPITERLRGVPRDEWSREDYEEEVAARQELADSCRHKAETMKWVMDVCAPLAASAPNVPVAELISLLPEPERSIAHDIVFATVPWHELPVQRHNRKAWHRRIEQAIATLLNGGSPFSTNDVLDKALVFEPAERPIASRYAEKLLEAAAGCLIR